MLKFDGMKRGGKFSQKIALGLLAGFIFGGGLQAGETQNLVSEQVEAEYASLESLYKHFHAHPELSLQETESANRIAGELHKVGYDVTEGFGGTGLVALLKNGEGPTVLLRADMDGLPVHEQTGLEYASSVKRTDPAGKEVYAMHACGHDMHMTTLVGAARVLSTLRDHWQGTLILIGQPAEEIGQGAKAMLKEGLFEKFPVPDYAFAFHVNANLPAGKIGYVGGYALANVDAMDIYVKGAGGHGAYPHTTKDPIVLAGQIVTALQTIVSRETSPLDSVVVTVGSIHGGSKHNIIPDEVHLQLTIRSYSDESRDRTIASIRRIVEGQAISAGMPKELYPEVILTDEYTPALYNDPELAERLAGALTNWLGNDNVVLVDPVMGGEDFGRYGRTEHKVPISIFWLGAVDPEKWRLSKEQGTALPSLHSSLFAPLPGPTIRTGVTSMAAVVLDLAASPR